MRRPSFELAHFSPEEIEILDELQGLSPEETKQRNGIKMYPGIEHLLMANPQFIKKGMERHYAEGGHVQAYARGGQVDIKIMARKGRYGDSKLAFIPRRVAELFDHILGKTDRDRNPQTNQKEYFGLGSFLKGVKDALGGGLSKAKQTALDLARQVPGAARSAAQSAGRTLQRTAQDVFGTTDPRELAEMARKGIGPAAQRALSGYLSGEDPRQAVLGGIQEGASQFDTPAASAIRTAASGAAAGQSPLEIAAKGLQSGAAHFQSPLSEGIQHGAEVLARGGGLKEAALQGAGTAGMGYGGPLGSAVAAGSDVLSRGGSLGQAALGAGTAGTAGSSNPLIKTAHKFASGLQGGESLGQAALGTAQEGLSHIPHPAAAAARAGLEEYQQSGDIGRAGAAGARQYYTG